MRRWVNHFSVFGFSFFNNHTYKLKSPLFDVIHQTYGLNITGFDPSLTFPVTKKWFFFFFCCALSLSHVWFLVTPWTVALQAPLSMGFFRQELEWAVILSSRGSSQPRDRTQVSHIAGRFFITWATRENRYWIGYYQKPNFSPNF